MLKSTTVARWLLLATPWLPCSSSPSVPPPPAEEMGNVTLGKEFSIHSAIMNEDRRFFVYLPKSYEASNGYAKKRYPVLYVLDGDTYFFTASGVMNFMSEGGVGNQYQVPEHIVVGVAQKDRESDLTPTRIEGWDTSGRGELFMRFLNEELMYRIESSYRTLPFKTLVGHSLGGLLTCCSLMDERSRFNAYLAIDPSLWWDNKLLVRQTDTKLTRHLTVPRTVFIGIDNSPHESRKSIRKFVGQIHSRQALGYSMGFKQFEHETHSSVPLVAMYHGLRFIFDGYEVSEQDAERAIESPAYIQHHFEKFSNRIGIQFLPPEERIDKFAASLKPEQALEFYRLNALNYPDSAHAQFALGKAAYETGGGKQLELAIHALERSLELNPDQPKAEEMLQKCRKQR